MRRGLAKAPFTMLTLSKFRDAGAKTQHFHGAVKCVERQLAQELEKHGVSFAPAPLCFCTAAAAAARVAVLSGLAHVELVQSGLLSSSAAAVVEDAVKVGLRLGTLPLYRSKYSGEIYNPENRY